MRHDFAQPASPFRADEWAQLLALTTRIGNSSVSRKLMGKTRPLGPGLQTVRHESVVAITEGLHTMPGENRTILENMPLDSSVVPIIFKDFVVHWRDIEEARLSGISMPAAKAAVAASACARREDAMVLFGDPGGARQGLMNVPGRNVIK